jgi:AraC-like DNA-binding protein
MGAINHAAPVRQCARLDNWNEIVGDTFAGCVVDADQPGFDGKLATCNFGTIGLARIKAQPSKVRRWLSNTPPKRSGSVFLHMQVGGTGINIQSGRETTISPGCAALCDPDRGYGVDFVTPYELFVLELPVSNITLAHPGFDLDRAAGRSIDPSRSRLLISFLRTAWSQLASLADDADWRECIDRVGLDLALRAIGQSIEPCEAGAPAELRRLVMNYIRNHLFDPELRTSSIARALNVSPRSVQTVFERLSTTASAFILDQRLSHAAERLRAERGRVSITQIAYDCGFSDSAYFSRCFSRNRGVSPRAYRLGRGQEVS